MRGKLITIEGGDGVGKSTQIALLKEALARQGADALFVREPGDTQIGEKLRQIILDPQNEQMCWDTEAMLYAAARVQLVTEKIVPALAEGRLVICDRYVDSSVAYQGFGRELGADYVLALNQRAWALARPDRTLYLALSPQQGILRKTRQQALDRLEAEGEAFRDRVQAGYAWVCDRNPERIRTISADGTPEEVHQRIWAALEDLL